jgi:hypothetical protein
VNNTLFASSYTVETGYRVDFTAGKAIVLKPGFKAKAGSNFHAFISPGIACSNSGKFRPSPNQPPTSTNIGQPPIKRKKGTYNENIDGSQNQIAVSPNPGYGIYKIESNLSDHLEVEILNLQGALIRTTSINSKDESINISDLPNGLYFFNCKSSSGYTKTIKVLKE